jgi:hypothetical protein
MKSGNSFWKNLIYFLTGGFVCYLTLQFDLLNINTEVHVPELLISVITAIIGLYIADTIQKKITKGQNQYSFLGSKLDSIWSAFNVYAGNIEFSTQVELSTVTSNHKNLSKSIDFLKTIFDSFELSSQHVVSLETNIDALETLLSSQPMAQNIINCEVIRKDIVRMISDINQNFSKILRQIHDL